MRSFNRLLGKRISALTAIGATLFTSLLASSTPAVSQSPSPRFFCPGLPNDRPIITLSSNNTLYTYNPAVGFINPRRINNGINGGNFIGIDFRPADGRLYGLTDTDQVYIIDPVTGEAKLLSILSTTFDGGFQSLMDFNPSVDRLRLIGSNDQNLAVNVDNGAVTPQTPLTYASGDRNQGINPSVSAGAYNNNFPNSPSTVLYNIDTEKDVLTIQNPTANGVNVTIGSLNFNAAPAAGLDIFSTPQGVNAAVAVSDTTLYCIDLNTGAATSIFPNTGRINTVPNVPNGGFIDVAISPNPLPAGPVFGSVAPTSGSPGTTVFIAGFNFDNPKVLFNGVEAKIQSATSTLITVTVPQGATTGPITITTPAGTATSSPGVFTVIPAASTQQ